GRPGGSGGGRSGEWPGRPAGQRVIARVARGENPERKLSAGIQAQTSDEGDAAEPCAERRDPGAGGLSQVIGGTRTASPRPPSLNCGDPYRFPPNPPHSDWGTPTASPKPPHPRREPPRSAITSAISEAGLRDRSRGSPWR